MDLDATPSEEARAHLAELLLEDDDGPTDFERIDEIRSEYREKYAAGAERAIARHDLELTEVTVGGVDCVRILSRSTGRSNGSMLYVFGGAFIVGDPLSDLPIIGALAERCGVEVVAPRYRLAPEHPPPAGLDDCYAVYCALASHTGHRLLLAGESAGGNLALRVAQRAAVGEVRAPSAMALLSPAVDLRTDRVLFGAMIAADPSLSYTRVLDVERAYVGANDPSDPSISPLMGPMESLPPTIITTGTRDLFLGMCVRLERKMRRAGVDVQCRVWDGMWHVFEYADAYPEAAESLAEIAAFLDSR